MNSTSISRRYARALFELAVEQNRLRETNHELLQACSALDEEGVQAMLVDPSVPREAKVRLAESVCATLKLSPIVANTLMLLAQRNRLVEAAAIEKAFGELADERAGRLKARLTSAVALEDEVAQALNRRLTEATKREVVLERSIDPSLLGGVVAQVGSRLYDGSLKTQFEQMRKELKR